VQRAREADGAPLALQLAKRVRFLHHVLPYQRPQIIAACALDVLEAFPRNDREWADVVSVLCAPPPEPDDRAMALPADVAVAPGRTADGVAPAASGDERIELSHESTAVEEPLKALQNDPNDTPAAAGQVQSLESTANEPSAESESESPIVSGQVQSSEAEVQSAEMRTESFAKSETESESERASKIEG
jgi:hypothetical protein